MAEIHLRPTAGGGGAYTPTGSAGSPVLVTAVGGLTAAGAQREIKFIAGNGGPVTVTATPQIAAGTIIGQELTLRGTNDTNTVALGDGNGLLLNGACTLRNGSSLALLWDGTLWVEVARNDR